MRLQACMGGFCRKREYCAHYHAIDRSDPAERLCIPGADGVGADVQVVIRMPVGAWERGAGMLLAPAHSMEAPG